jgi:hypothetical protein
MAHPRGFSPNPDGRPAMEPTPEQRNMVTVLAGMRVPDKIIAEQLGILDSRTLRRHFAAELVDGRENLIATLKSQIVGAAMRGSVRAQTWLLERLEPEQFAPRYRQPGEDMPLIPLSDDDNPVAKVEIYLPDNARSPSDVSAVTRLSPPPLIDAKRED